MKTSKPHLEQEWISTLKTLRTYLDYALQISRELREHSSELSANQQYTEQTMSALLVELQRILAGPHTK